jgi:hypothetical protein
MKIATLLRSTCVVLIFHANAIAWNQTEFMIFTFFDPCLPQNTDTASATDVRAAQSGFQKAHDAYFNLLTGTQEPSNIAPTQAGMDFALFIASKVPGLKYLVVDKGFYNSDTLPALRPYQSDTAARLTDHYAKDLGARFPLRQNAMLGYNLGDEPPLGDARNVKNWVSHIKKRDGTKLAFVNLFPVYGFENRAAYEAYVDSFVNDPVPTNRPDAVCFDHYPFFKDGKVRQDYFYNLRIIGKKAGNRPWWVFIQSVDHLNYVDPSAAHMRFMALCPVAYGAKGIGYFTYEQPDLPGYRDALFNACTTRTPKYAVAQTINHYLKKIAGPVAMNSTWKGAYHKSKKPTGETDLPLTSKNAPCVGDIGNDSCLIGIFQSDRPATTWYFVVINKSLRPVYQVVVTLKGNCSGRISKAPSIINYAGDTTYSAVPTDPEGTTMTIPALQGGEGRFYRITDVADPK